MGYREKGFFESQRAKDYLLFYLKAGEKTSGAQPLFKTHAIYVWLTFMRSVGESNPPNHNWAVPAIMINLPIEAS